MLKKKISMRKAAIISKCGQYRYVLSREWSSKGVFAAKPKYMMFVGLNPSTADAELDDATLRRCIGFAKALGYNGLYMVNLFAFRTKSPKLMQSAEDPVGKLNDGWLLNMAVRAAAIVVCWGTNGGFRDRDRKVLELLKPYNLFCLDVNTNGSPAHPLYLPQTSELIQYPPAERE